MCGKEQEFMTLNGTTAIRSNIVGFCRLHRVHLTKAQVQQKECVCKGCRALKKWDCAYWRRKERIKEVKRIKKEQGVPSWQRVEIRTDHNGNLVSAMRTKKLKKR